MKIITNIYKRIQEQITLMICSRELQLKPIFAKKSCLNYKNHSEVADYFTKKTS